MSSHDPLREVLEAGPLIPLARLVRELRPTSSGYRRHLVTLGGEHFVVSHKPREEPIAQRATAGGEVLDEPVAKELVTFLRSIGRLAW